MRRRARSSRQVDDELKHPPVIKSGAIQYKEAQIQEVSVRFVGTTAILLNKIRLVAVVVIRW